MFTCPGKLWPFFHKKASHIIKPTAMAVEVELKFEPAHHPKEQCVKDGEADSQLIYILVRFGSL